MCSHAWATMSSYPLGSIAVALRVSCSFGRASTWCLLRDLPQTLRSWHDRHADILGRPASFGGGGDVAHAAPSAAVSWSRRHRVKGAALRGKLVVTTRTLHAGRSRKDNADGTH